jgi:hypothetical protein
MLENYKEEIKIAGLYDDDSDYGGMVGQALERLVECHLKEGHSGMSHYHLVHLFHKLMTTNILTPLQGTDDEFVEVGEQDGKPLFQNKRRSSVFKCGNDVYDIDGGPVFEDKNGCTFTNRHSVLHNITFPYTPVSKRQVLPEFESIKLDRVQKAHEFNAMSINDINDCHYDFIKRQLLRWAHTTINSDEYNMVYYGRFLEKKHVDYLTAGLKFIGIPAPDLKFHQI